MVIAIIFSSTSVYADETQNEDLVTDNTPVLPDEDESKDQPFTLKTITIELNTNESILGHQYMSIVKDQFHVTDVTVDGDQGKTIQEDAVMKDGDHVFHDGVEYILDFAYRGEDAFEEAPTITFFPTVDPSIEEPLTMLPKSEVNDISDGVNVEEDNESIADTVNKDNEGNDVGETALIESDMNKKNDVTMDEVFPTYEIILDAGKAAITVREWMELNPSKSIVITDLLGNTVTEDVVLEDDLIVIIDGEKIRLDVITSQIEEINMVGKKVIPLEESKLNPDDAFYMHAEPVKEEIVSIAPVEAKQISEEDKKTKAKEKAEAEKAAKIKADAESQIKELIKAQVDAKIEEDRKAQEEVFMNKAYNAQLVLNNKLKTWLEAKTELSNVNKAAEAIQVIKGKPDMDQVAVTFGQYQSIANKLTEAKRYNDVVSVISDAVEVLTDKNVDKNIITEFVKKSIPTSDSMQILLKDVKKQNVDVPVLKKYQKELKYKEEIEEQSKKSKWYHWRKAFLDFVDWFLQ